MDNPLDEIIDALIALHLHYRKTNDSAKFLIGSAKWAEEFCTIHCNIGRRTGKTSYIKARAKDGDLVVVANSAIRDAVFKKCKFDILVADNMNILSLHETILGVNRIFVDEPALVFKSISRQKFFSLLSPGNEKTFILLGE